METLPDPGHFPEIAFNDESIPVRVYTEEEIKARMDCIEHERNHPALLAAVEQRLSAIDDTELWKFCLGAFICESYRMGGLNDIITEIEGMKP